MIRVKFTIVIDTKVWEQVHEGAIRERSIKFFNDGFPSIMVRPSKNLKPLEASQN